MADLTNQEAWERLFERYDIAGQVEREGHYIITAPAIKEYREPRLMTKFDYRIHRPPVFRDNRLAILPITRGSYIISNFEAYHDIETPNEDVIYLTPPTNLESVDFFNIPSEASAINCAYLSGLLENFLEDGELLPTVSGRMKSGIFSYHIHNTRTDTDMQVNASNLQIEIDGGYEGEQSLALLEAKNSLSNDFIVRQIYFPYRRWSQGLQKQVRPVFMTYSNSMYSLYEYTFTVPDHYNSLRLVRQQNYSFERFDISMHDIIAVYRRVRLVDEPRLQFPQADNFHRVINLCELLKEQRMDRGEITTEYDFDPRQTNYYTDAARYLGLVEKCTEEGGIMFCLTNLGQEVMGLRYRARQLKLVELILSHRAFRKTFQEFMGDGEMPARDVVIQHMRESNLYRVDSDSTFRRRSSTVMSWIRWITELAAE